MLTTGYEQLNAKATREIFSALWRGIYPNLMRLDYDNARTRSGGSLQELTMPEERTPLELFAAFFRRQNERDMSDEQRQFMEAKIEEIWEGER